MDIVASSGQRKGGCGHIMASVTLMFAMRVVEKRVLDQTLVYKARTTAQLVCF